MKKALVSLFGLALILFVLVGCSSSATITFDSNGGSEVPAITIESKEALDIKKLPVPTKENHEFLGWYTAKDGGELFKKTTLEEDVTLYAHWEINSYKVKFVVDGKETTVSVKHGDTATFSQTPTKEGYNFVGWDKSLENISSNVTINAVFEIKTFEVSFMVDGKLYGEKQTVNYGESATAPENPTKEGYTFKAWDKVYTNVKENLIINASFDDNYYTVEFVVDGKVVKEEKVKHGEAAEAPANPSKEGHEFTGWDKAYSEVKSDLTVTAEFSKLVYTVKFFVDGNQYGETQNIEYGENAQAPANPEKTNYEFKSWDKEFTNVTSNLEVNAVFEISNYTVKFLVDGTLYGEVQNIAPGGNAVQPLDPTKQYYTFISWDKEFNNVTSNLEVNAIFEADVYNVSFFNGVTEITTLELKEYKSSETTSLPTLDKNGELYFIGWHKKSDLTDEITFEIEMGTEEDLTFYASFVSLDFNGGMLNWTFSGFDDTNTASKGIDAVSNLPEIFEQDFYTYLKDNNLLSTLGWEQGKATTWEAFSGINPNHGGDPYKIWNDTSSGFSGGTPGYVGSYLWDTATCAQDGSLIDIEGGFLGSEPYKSKYINLSKHLALMLRQRYQSNSMDENTSSAKNLVAFILDGYFYGTQGLTGSTVAAGFKPLREVVPTTLIGYTLTDSTVTPYETEYKATVGGNEITRNLILPMKEGFVFAGWSSTLNGEKITSAVNVGSTITTLYAIWIALE